MHNDDSKLKSILDELFSTYDYMPCDSDQKSKSLIDKTLVALNDLYNNGYRNSYYIAFQVISDVLTNNKSYPDVIDAILHDLSIECESITLKHKKDISKLIDYLFLELSRYNSFNADLKNASEKATELQEMYDGFWNTTQQIDNDIYQTKSQMSDMIGKSVSILGIFTGIVMAFTGGLTALTGAFESLNSNVSKYRIFALFSIIGIILYNIIIILMFFISRVSGKDIGISCKNNYLSCNDCKKYNRKETVRKRIICQAINKYPHIILGELILIYILYIICITWLFSQRNKELFTTFFSYIANYPKTHDIIFIITLILPIIIVFLFIFIFFRKPYEENFDEDIFDTEQKYG